METARYLHQKANLRERPAFSSKAGYFKVAWRCMEAVKMIHGIQKDSAFLLSIIHGFDFDEGCEVA